MAQPDKKRKSTVFEEGLAEGSSSPHQHDRKKGSAVCALFVQGPNRSHQNDSRTPYNIILPRQTFEIDIPVRVVLSLIKQDKCSHIIANVFCNSNINRGCVLLLKTSANRHYFYLLYTCEP